MFSANGLPENCVYRPKNGPVPCRPVNAYGRGNRLCGITECKAVFDWFAQPYQKLARP